MKLKRFDNLHEAAKKETKATKAEAVKFILDELKKKKMSRSMIVDAVEKKFDDRKLAQSVADDVSFGKFQKENDIEKENFKGVVKIQPKKSYPCYFIGDEAKDPDGCESTKKKEDKKEDKKSGKIKRYDDFDEKEAKSAKKDAEKDMEEEKKDDKTERQTNFQKDSLDQLYKKRGDDNYKEYWTEIEDEISERPRKKGRK
jgi:hypothetical protein